MGDAVAHTVVEAGASTYVETTTLHVAKTTHLAVPSPALERMDTEDSL
jgi:hypothetical protein